jgi:hypothetical protein
VDESAEGEAYDECFRDLDGQPMSDEQVIALARCLQEEAREQIAVERPVGRPRTTRAARRRSARVAGPAQALVRHRGWARLAAPRRQPRDQRPRHLPAWDRQNLELLSNALVELDAVLRLRAELGPVSCDHRRAAASDQHHPVAAPRRATSTC